MKETTGRIMFWDRRGSTRVRMGMARNLMSGIRMGGWELILIICARVYKVNR